MSEGDVPWPEVGSLGQEVAWAGPEVDWEGSEDGSSWPEVVSSGQEVVWAGPEVEGACPTPIPYPSGTSGPRRGRQPRAERTCNGEKGGDWGQNRAIGSKMTQNVTKMAKMSLKWPQTDTTITKTAPN